MVALKRKKPPILLGPSPSSLLQYLFFPLSSSLLLFLFSFCYVVCSMQEGWILFSVLLFNISKIAFLPNDNAKS